MWRKSWKFKGAFIPVRSSDGADVSSTSTLTFRILQKSKRIILFVEGTVHYRHSPHPRRVIKVSSDNIIALCLYSLSFMLLLSHKNSTPHCPHTTPTSATNPSISLQKSHAIKLPPGIVRHQLELQRILCLHTPRPPWTRIARGEYGACEQGRSRVFGARGQKLFLYRGRYIYT